MGPGLALGLWGGGGEGGEWGDGMDLPEDPREVEQPFLNHPICTTIRVL